MNQRDNRPTIRVGVMLDSWVVPAWVGSLIDEIVETAFCEIPLVVLDGRLPRPLRSRLRKLPRNALYYLYERLDRRLLGPSPDAFAPVDLRHRLQDAAAITVRPYSPRPWEDRFQEADVKAIEEQELDVLLRFGFNVIKGGILDAARCGVWSYHHGDNREYRGGPALFWEIHEDNPVSGTILQVLTEELDGGHAIYRSYAPTYRFSLARNRNATYWKTARFVKRCLCQLREHGWDWVRSQPGFDDPIPYQRRIYRMPTNREMTVFLWRLGRRVARRAAEKAWRREEWIVALRCRPSPDAPPPQDLSEFSVLPSPPGRWLADPTLLKDGDVHHLFVEDYDPAVGRASISTISIGPDGRLGELRPVLGGPEHLSYPHVMRNGDEVMMLPEMESRRAIELYRAISLPDRWEPLRVLLADVRAVDSTLLRHDGRWWLFTSLYEEGANPWDELFLFFSETLDGPWTEHAASPVVSDARRARPAGAIFEHSGQLIRPAQDCTGGYGRRVVLCRIDQLTVTNYEETSIGTIEPFGLAGALRTHMYSRDGDWEAVDAYRFKRRLTKGSWLQPSNSNGSSDPSQGG